MFINVFVVICKLLLNKFVMLYLVVYMYKYMLNII